jgi:hypothetical protein
MIKGSAAKATVGDIIQESRAALSLNTGGFVRIANRRRFGEVSAMSDFKGHRFPTELILLCVHWYCKFGIRLSLDS